MVIDLEGVHSLPLRGVLEICGISCVLGEWLGGRNGRDGIFFLWMDLLADFSMLPSPT